MNKVFKRLTNLLIFSLSVVLAAGNTVSALTDIDRQQLYKPFYDPGAVSACSGTNGSTSNSAGSIYVLGDSLTVGMRDAGDLDTKLSDAGWQAVKINAEVGRDLAWGNDQIQQDSSLIAETDSILVGLGTNNVATVVNGGTPVEGGKDQARAQMQLIVDGLRSINEDINIYWTSFHIAGTLTTRFGTFDMDGAKTILNDALSEIAVVNSNVRIVPWGTSSEAVELVTDGIHPSGNYPEMADFIVKSLSEVASGQGVSASGCVCSVTGGASRDERYRNTWSYLVGNKGLSEEAAAGLMGNLEAESGIDPHNTQNNAPVPDGPEIPIDAIRGSFGYGIAQWTSAGRQDNLIAYAKETSRSTGDLGLQLDFLWKELSENYTGVLAVLQTPEISIEEASDEVILRFETPEAVLPPPRSTAERRAAALAARRVLGTNIYNEFSGQSIDSGVGAGCGASGVNIDLVSDDTTHIECSADTPDRGLADGYRDGKLIRIRLCEVDGASVNSQLAASVKQMINDAATEGVIITINGSFRSMDGQINIYNSWCGRGGITPTPPPYPKPSRSDYTRCPGGAPPGYSNHQGGLALDLECEGRLIPQSYTSAQDNACFRWLVNNASNYGLYEWGKGGEDSRSRAGYEGWHWSVDGN